MKIDVVKFGELLISRPAGREAALIVKAYLAPQNSLEQVELDFAGVKVLAPSWLDEFVTGLRQALPNPLIFLPSENSSVKESLLVLEGTF